MWHEAKSFLKFSLCSGVRRGSVRWVRPSSRGLRQRDPSRARRRGWDPLRGTSWHARGAPDQIRVVSWWRDFLPKFFFAIFRPENLENWFMNTFEDVQRSCNLSLELWNHCKSLSQGFFKIYVHTLSVTETLFDILKPDTIEIIMTYVISIHTF